MSDGLIPASIQEFEVFLLEAFDWLPMSIAHDNANDDEIAFNA